MAANANASQETPHPYEAQDSITRPADTTQYAAGDALSDNATTPTANGYFELDFKVKGGGGILLTDFTLLKSDQDTTGAEIDLLLFTTLPALAGFEDNAVVAITDDEMKECKGVVRFEDDAWTNHGTGNIQTVAKTIGVVFASGAGILYAIPVLQGTYTPASAEVFTLTAKAMRG